MSIIKLLPDLFQRMLGKHPCPLPTKHQMNVQARAIRHLIKTGFIDARTVQRLGTTSPHRVINRIRKLGYLRRLDHPKAFILRPNRSGYGSYRDHAWSGFNPQAERRTAVRGGKN